MFDSLKQAWERLRSLKGFSTWLWIVILFVILAIGLLLNDPLPPTPGEAGKEGFGSSSTGLALSVFFRWIALIGFIYLAFLFFRKWQTNKGGLTSHRISISERFYLSPKQALLLVKLNGREFLIGATDSSINLLAEVGSNTESQIEEPNDLSDFETILENEKTHRSGLNHE